MRPFARVRLAWTLLMSCGLLAGSSGAAPMKAAGGNWPAWRGPQMNGHSDDVRVPLHWSRTENLKWTIDLPGTGNSSPIVWGERIFLAAAGSEGPERWVLCIDRASGKILWQQTAALAPSGEPVHDWNTPASSTCATDGERVYAFFGASGVFCYDFDGKLQWKKELGKLVSSTGWGVSGGSPLLFEDLVIINGDQGAKRGQVDEAGVDYGPSWLWALNKYTGEVIWKSERNQGMGWCTPIIWSIEGRQELVLNGQLGVWSYDPRTGRELWHVVGRGEEEGFGEVTPVWGRDLLYVFTGKPGPAWAIRAGGRGDVSDSHVVWKIQRTDRDVSSPLLLDDRLYTFSRIGVTTCVDAQTGALIWRGRLGGTPCASMISLRGKVLFLSDDGTAYVVEPGAEFKLLHTNKLGDGDLFRASPAVADGQLFIRSDRRLYCIEAGSDEVNGATP